jgi:hypothetical protein
LQKSRACGNNQSLNEPKRPSGALSRYRAHKGTFDTLQREVRALTDEISEARRELERELPGNRRDHGVPVAKPPGEQD